MRTVLRTVTLGLGMIASACSHGGSRAIEHVRPTAALTGAATTAVPAQIAGHIAPKPMSAEVSAAAKECRRLHETTSELVACYNKQANALGLTTIAVGK